MNSPSFPFKELTLPYSPEELEPHLSAATFQTHYDEHYKRDLLMLNATVAATSTLHNWTLSEIILSQIRREPVPLQNTAKFYAGSVYNHNLYFSGMNAAKSTSPSGNLLSAIDKQYGSVAQLESLLLDAASTMLGVGWIWLNSEQDGNIHISITRGNETPQLSAVTPIFALDTWEHAYIDQYGNHIDHYVDNWFHILDWDAAGKRFDESTQTIALRRQPDPSPTTSYLH